MNPTQQEVERMFVELYHSTATAKIANIFRSLSLCFGLASLLLFSLNSHAQEFYKWVDSNGSTHYTTTPPPKNKGVKQKGKINTYGWQNNPSSTVTPPVPSATTTAPPGTKITPPVVDPNTGRVTQPSMVVPDGRLRNATPDVPPQPSTPASTVTPQKSI